MVTITNYSVNQTTEGEHFISLQLEGDLEMVQSVETGNFYATARRTNITSTFNEPAAKLLIGRQIPGAIVKESCEPYEYTIQETGEVITLDYKYVYVQESQPTARKLSQVNNNDRHNGFLVPKEDRINVNI